MIRNRVFLYFSLKIIVTILLVRWLVETVDRASLIKTFQSFSKWTFIASVLSLWVAYLIYAWRWRYILLKRERCSFTFKNSLTIASIGNLLNQCVPGSIAGDVYRGFSLGRFGFSRTCSIQSIFVDRLFGLVFNCIVGISAVFFIDPIYLNKKEVWLMCLFLGGICFGFIVFCFLDQVPIPNGLKKFISPIQDTSSFCRSLIKIQNVRFYLAGIGLTLFYYLPVYFFARDLDSNLSFAAILFVLPAISLITFLPISFAGWGVREVSFVFFFKLFGLTGDQSLSLSIAYGLVSLFSVMPGIVFYFFKEQGKNKKK